MSGYNKYNKYDILLTADANMTKILLLKAAAAWPGMQGRAEPLLTICHTNVT